MMDNMGSEAGRLESLWGGRFGDDYIERNQKASEGRAPFWNDILSKYPAQRVLEVGCNVGANLRWIAQKISPRDVYGLDINENAVREVRRQFPGINVLWSPARDIAFRDGWFELVFTAGVLIHQPEESLRAVMREIVRCSRRWVLCMEYFAERTVEVPYRGQAGALFKRDYGAIYRDEFPSLALRETNRLTREQGWDDVTYWLFEKQRG
jgi:pseudaminic acid biosynthesis-associated methylase